MISGGESFAGIAILVILASAALVIGRVITWKDLEAVDKWQTVIVTVLLLLVGLPAMAGIIMLLFEG